MSTNTKIAELMGWTNIAAHHPPSSLIEGQPPNAQHVGMLEMIPEFETSLDACATFEAPLSDQEYEWYVECLGEIVKADYIENDHPGEYRKFISATAPQRCAAFIQIKETQS